MEISDTQLLAELHRTQEELESTKLELKHAKRSYKETLAEKNSKLQVLGRRCKAFRTEIATLRDVIGDPKNSRESQT